MRPRRPASSVLLPFSPRSSRFQIYELLRLRRPTEGLQTTVRRPCGSVKCELRRRQLMLRAGLRLLRAAIRANVLGVTAKETTNNTKAIEQTTTWKEYENILFVCFKLSFTSNAVLCAGKLLFNHSTSSDNSAIADVHVPREDRKLRIEPRKHGRGNSSGNRYPAVHVHR